MPGRLPKPVQLHLLEGNKSRLSKKRIKAKKDAEIRFGDLNFKMPKAVRGRKYARNKWKEIIRLYVDYEVDFVSTSDTTILERYCLTYADYMYLQDVRTEIEKKGQEKRYDTVSVFITMDKLNLAYNISKTADLLTKLEDRLFLNPLSKIRSVPHKKEKSKIKSDFEKLGFRKLEGAG